MALERSDAFRFRLRKSYSSATLSKRSQYDPTSYTLRKSISSSSLVPVTYDESVDYYRPWSRKFYRDLYYPDNDYFWYRYYNVGTRVLSYPGVKRLHSWSEPSHTYTHTNYPRHRWTQQDSLYSGWRRYYDTSLYQPYRWWSYSANYNQAAYHDYSYKPYHAYPWPYHPYAASYYPYKFTGPKRKALFDFMYS